MPPGGDVLRTIFVVFRGDDTDAKKVAGQLGQKLAKEGLQAGKEWLKGFGLGLEQIDSVVETAVRKARAKAGAAAGGAGAGGPGGSGGGPPPPPRGRGVEDAGDDDAQDAKRRQQAQAAYEMGEMRFQRRVNALAEQARTQRQRDQAQRITSEQDYTRRMGALQETATRENATRDIPQQRTRAQQIAAEMTYARKQTDLHERANTENASRDLTRQRAQAQQVVGEMSFARKMQATQAAAFQQNTAMDAPRRRAAMQAGLAQFGIDDTSIRERQQRVRAEHASRQRMYQDLFPAEMDTRRLSGGTKREAAATRRRESEFESAAQASLTPEQRVQSATREREGRPVNRGGMGGDPFLAFSIYFQALQTVRMLGDAFLNAAKQSASFNAEMRSFDPQELLGGIGRVNKEMEEMSSVGIELGKSLEIPFKGDLVETALHALATPVRLLKAFVAGGELLPRAIGELFFDQKKIEDDIRSRVDRLAASMSIQTIIVKMQVEADIIGFKAETAQAFQQFAAGRLDVGMFRKEAEKAATLLTDQFQVSMGRMSKERGLKRAQLENMLAGAPNTPQARRALQEFDRQTALEQDRALEQYGEGRIRRLLGVTQQELMFKQQLADADRALVGSQIQSVEAQVEAERSLSRVLAERLGTAIPDTKAYYETRIQLAQTAMEAEITAINATNKDQRVKDVEIAAARLKGGAEQDKLRAAQRQAEQDDFVRQTRLADATFEHRKRMNQVMPQEEMARLADIADNDRMTQIGGAVFPERTLEERRQAAEQRLQIEHSVLDRIAEANKKMGTQTIAAEHARLRGIETDANRSWQDRLAATEQRIQLERSAEDQVFSLAQARRQADFQDEVQHQARVVARYAQGMTERMREEEKLANLKKSLRDREESAALGILGEVQNARGGKGKRRGTSASEVTREFTNLARDDQKILTDFSRGRTDAPIDRVMQAIRRQGMFRGLQETGGDVASLLQRGATPAFQIDQKGQILQTGVERLAQSGTQFAAATETFQRAVTTFAAAAVPSERDMPAYESGGFVNRTGPIYAHAGEYVVPAANARKDDGSIRVLFNEGQSNQRVATGASAGANMGDFPERPGKWSDTLRGLYESRLGAPVARPEWGAPRTAVAPSMQDSLNAQLAASEDRLFSARTGLPPLRGAALQAALGTATERLAMTQAGARRPDGMREGERMSDQSVQSEMGGRPRYNAIMSTATGSAEGISSRLLGGVRDYRGVSMQEGLSRVPAPTDLQSSPLLGIADQVQRARTSGGSGLGDELMGHIPRLAAALSKGTGRGNSEAQAAAFINRLIPIVTEAVNRQVEAERATLYGRLR